MGIYVPVPCFVYGPAAGNVYARVNVIDHSHVLRDLLEFPEILGPEGAFVEGFRPRVACVGARRLTGDIEQATTSFTFPSLHPEPQVRENVGTGISIWGTRRLSEAGGGYEGARKAKSFGEMVLVGVFTP